MRIVGWVIAATLLVAAPSVWAQSAPSDPVDLGDVVYYVVDRPATLYLERNLTKPYARVGFREPVFLISRSGGWSRVHTQDGAYGYIRNEAISNVWIRVSKLRQRLYLYEGTKMVVDLPADFGFNAWADKLKRGSEEERDHWRTPEGLFYVVHKNPHSKYYKALLLNYPAREDAERGLHSGLINQAEYSAIMQAELASQVPPMHTLLGGMIEIHGDGTGLSTNWTQGCVAIKNAHMDRIWALVSEGTPVIIEK